MKEYELVILAHPDLESNLDVLQNKVHQTIKDSGGEIIKEDNWGKKRLAYRIKKEDFAIYLFLKLNLPAEAPKKISNILNITDEVLRHLLVKADVRNEKSSEEEESVDQAADVETSQEKEE